VINFESALMRDAFNCSSPLQSDHVAVFFPQYTATGSCRIDTFVLDTDMKQRTKGTMTLMWFVVTHTERQDLCSGITF
jgi:hypothetical protein